MKRMIANSGLMAVALMLLGGCATTPPQPVEPDTVVDGERFVSDINTVLRNAATDSSDMWTQKLPDKPEPKPRANAKNPPMGPQADTSAYRDTTDDGKGKITASGTGFPNEAPENVFDGKDSKWCNEGGTMWVQYAYDGGAKQKVTAYTIMSANDGPGRDPKNWKLLGSNDGKEWTELDSRQDQNFGARFEKRLFEVKTPGEYSIYKLDVTANHGDVSSQFSELELLVKK